MWRGVCGGWCVGVWVRGGAGGGEGGGVDEGVGGRGQAKMSGGGYEV